MAEAHFRDGDLIRISLLFKALKHLRKKFLNDSSHISVDGINCGPGQHFGIYRFDSDRHYVIEAIGQGKVECNEYTTAQIREWDLAQRAKDPKATIRRAMSNIGNEFKYSTISNNCEHWARYWLTGDEKDAVSLQVRGFAGGASAGGVVGATSGAIIRTTVPVASQFGGLLRYAAFMTRPLWFTNPGAATALTLGGASIGAAIGWSAGAQSETGYISRHEVRRAMFRDTARFGLGQLLGCVMGSEA